MIRAVVFDLGEVLTSPPDLLPTLAARIDCEVTDLRAVYGDGRLAYDGGCGDLDYWGPILTALGKSADEALALELANLDASVWSQLRPTSWQLLRDVRSAGLTVAVLTNSPHAMQRMADIAPWRPDVDHLFVSASLGLLKPYPAIFERVADRLGLDAADIAFIDDRAGNVEAAAALGWRTHLWHDDADTREWLERLGGV